MSEYVTMASSGSIDETNKDFITNKLETQKIANSLCDIWWDKKITTTELRAIRNYVKTIRWKIAFISYVDYIRKDKNFDRWICIHQVNKTPIYFTKDECKAQWWIPRDSMSLQCNTGEKEIGSWRDDTAFLSGGVLYDTYNWKVQFVQYIDSRPICCK
jgi:hypothetical protein